MFTTNILLLQAEKHFVQLTFFGYRPQQIDFTTILCWYKQEKTRLQLIFINQNFSMYGVTVYKSRMGLTSHLRLWQIQKHQQISNVSTRQLDLRSTEAGIDTFVQTVG